MPIECRYDETAQVLYETGRGRLTLEDFAVFCRSLAEMELPDDLRVLSDYTAAELNLSYDEMCTIRDLYQAAEVQAIHLREAICVSAEREYGILRIYATIAADDNHEFMLFRSLAEGREWLGLPPSA